MNASLTKTKSCLIRWLHAYGRQQASRRDAVTWEISQVTRQVACEPLWRGHTLMRASVGLVVDLDRSIWAGGWTRDAHTAPTDDGRIVSRRDGRPDPVADRYWRRWSARRPSWHGEVAIDLPVYAGVAVRGAISTLSERDRDTAMWLADRYDWPREQILEVPPMRV